MSENDQILKRIELINQILYMCQGRRGKRGRKGTKGEKGEQVKPIFDICML